ncbi:aurora kinase A-interacting protein [Bombina bombina]|uniref:aurora kinase A-interacting protein n=1 Tax=Bombina bombina TaxID=8345 RepID=UPI00235AFFFD|nr:aurora kinase A-interacting protein [Bombina bombina]
MWLTRLTSQLAKVTRSTGILIPQCRSLIQNHSGMSASYSSQQPPRQMLQHHAWYNMEHELDEILVPRMMSISPLESFLVTRYSLPKSEGFNTWQEPAEHSKSYECPSHQDCEDMDEETEERNIVQCKNVLKIRRRKMNKHKYKKLQKRTKFLRRKIKDGRRRRKQANFERELKRIWRKAGLKNPPEGWHVPKIYVKH